MTLLEDRPTAESPRSEPAAPSSTRSSRLSTWRFAARLARREVRSRPGRTLLVMLLVAIPVIGMAGASIVARTTIETNEQAFARVYGTADALVAIGLDPVDFEPTGPEALAIPTLPDLPTGTTTTTYFSTYTQVRALIGGEQSAEDVIFTDIDLTDPITEGTTTVIEGRVPSNPGEVLLAPDLAKIFDVEVGDSLRLVRPGLELRVVGFGQDSAWSDSRLMVVSGFDRDLLLPAMTRFETLVDLPDSLSFDERETALGDLIRADLTVQRSDEEFYYEGSSVSARQLAWGWVAGVLAFVAVGIVIAAAFATSARRQLVTIGQLAANGAAPRLVRRTMGLQGMWTGLLGVAVGVPVAVLTAVAVRQTTLFDRLAGRRVEGLRISALDLAVVGVTAAVAATIAALVPARSAARIPVLSALAGRRPLAQPPAWLAPIGVASFVTGLLLLAAAASVENPGDLIALVAVFGALAVVFGMVCASPLIVSAVADVGSCRGGSIRLAARSLGRARARSAAVLTAIATVGTIAVIGSTVVSSAENADNSTENGNTIAEVAYVEHHWGEGNGEEAAVDGIYDPEPVIASSLPDTVRSDIERVLPDATWTPLSRVVFDPPPYVVATGQDVDQPGVDRSVRHVTPVVADDAVRSLIDFDDDQLAELEQTGVLVVVPWVGDEVAIPTLDDPIVVDVSGSMNLFEAMDRLVEGEVGVQIEQVGLSSQIAEAFVTPRFVNENGLTLTLSSYRIDNGVDVTRAQFDELNQVQSMFQPDSFVESASAPGFELEAIDGDDAWFANSSYPSTQVPWSLLQAAVAVASLLLVLSVVAIGLSLAATESRDERDVLLAVGASPATLRRVAASKAWVLTAGAGLTAVPVGYITIVVITRAIGANDVTAPFPFAIAAALIVVIPALAWLATLATSMLAQRVRPVTASTITTD